MTIGAHTAIGPLVGGQAFVTGWSRYVLMNDDPVPEGFMVADIWSIADESSPAATLATKRR